jgi:hypothetical protein
VWLHHNPTVNERHRRFAERDICATDQNFFRKSTPNFGAVFDILPAEDCPCPMTAVSLRGIIENCPQCQRYGRRPVIMARNREGEHQSACIWRPSLWSLPGRAGRDESAMLPTSWRQWTQDPAVLEREWRLFGAYAESVSRAGRELRGVALSVPQATPACRAPAGAWPQVHAGPGAGFSVATIGS